MIQYDPSIILLNARRLYSQATVLIITSTIMCALFGAALGYGFVSFFDNIKNLSSDFNWLPLSGSAITGLLAGAIILGFLGFLGGQQRAFMLKLQAQTALCQLKIEENTRH